MPPANPRILDRFWSKVRVSGDGDCWQWRSSVDTYGRFRILRDQRCIGAHRFSWILANRRDIPDDLLVMHECDNKRCVNPAHLQLGTASDNTRDAVAKGLIDMEKAWAGRRKADG